jgi:hypothetical protein
MTDKKNLLSRLFGPKSPAADCCQVRIVSDDQPESGATGSADVPSAATDANRANAT